MSPMLTLLNYSECKTLMILCELHGLSKASRIAKCLSSQPVNLRDLLINYQPARTVAVVELALIRICVKTAAVSRTFSVAAPILLPFTGKNR